MGKTLLVSLVSDQTIPNVQLINEFQDQIDEYLFISTTLMEKKNVRKWIVKACNLPDSKLVEPVIVDQFSFDDIEIKLDAYSFDSLDKVIVNLTGGTKVMTLASFDFFRDLGAEIFYLTGSDDTLIKLSPGRKKKVEKLRSTVNVMQYLNAYGFDIKESLGSDIPIDYTIQFFTYFVEGKIQPYNDVLNFLRPKRDKNYVTIKNIERLSDLLQEVNFPSKNADQLNHLEIKYLTGEWFEEYITYTLIKELGLNNDQIKVGLNIFKKNKDGISIPNEMDVLFTWKNKLYTIECKTSLFYESLQSDGTYKTNSIISETLYKSDSLKQGLGLFVNPYLFVLDNLSDYWAKIRTHMNRAELFNIKIIDKKALTSGVPLRSLIGIEI